MKKITIIILIIIITISTSSCVSKKIEDLKQEADTYIEDRDYEKALSLYEEIVELDDNNEENLEMYDTVDAMNSLSINMEASMRSRESHDSTIGGYDLNVYLNDNLDLFENRLVSHASYINYCLLLYAYTDDKTYEDIAVVEYYKYTAILDTLMMEKFYNAEAFMNFTHTQVALGGFYKDPDDLTGPDIYSGLPWVFSDETVYTYQKGDSPDLSRYIFVALKYFDIIDNLPEEIEELHEISVEMYESINELYAYVYYPIGLSKYYEKVDELTNLIYVNLTIRQQDTPNYEDYIEELNYNLE